MDATMMTTRTGRLETNIPTASWGAPGPTNEEELWVLRYCYFTSQPEVRATFTSQAKLRFRCNLWSSHEPYIL